MAISEKRQTAALSVLYDLAKREIADALRLIDAGDSAAVADVIHTVVPVIADRYGLAAGVLAVDWYDETREAAEAAGLFQAVPAPLPDAGRYESMAAWAAGKDDIETLVSGGVQRIIADAHRDTVIRAAFADPQARGWARFTGGGDGSCPFCYMLISRGGVFTSDTARFGSHDHCNCGAGPIFKGRAGTQKVDEYKKGARRREDADGNAIGSTEADQERAKEWISAHLT